MLMSRLRLYLSYRIERGGPEETGPLRPDLFSRFRSFRFVAVFLGKQTFNVKLAQER